MKYVVIGYGQRGEIYAENFQGFGYDELVAVCDPDEEHLERARKLRADVPTFKTEEEFFAAGKLADVCVIATPDRAHARQALTALDLGYDLILEKPIACDVEDIKKIQEKAQKLNRKIFVCHVLRYSPFFLKIKRELETGKYGKVITINQTENVCWWHQAHSYVRGNWHNKAKSAPMIIAKCCHDLDILNWLIDEPCVGVSSMGSLMYFNEKHAPEGAAKTCYECTEKDCIYHCENIYWNTQNRWFLGNQYESKEALREALLKSGYANCVFLNDNDVVDHQVVNLQYASGTTAHLTMTAFSEKIYRDVHVHCEKGNLYGRMEDNVLYCNVFGKEQQVIDVTTLGDAEQINLRHGGGDYYFIKTISDYYRGIPFSGMSSIEQSMSSHIVGFAAEESRLKGGELIKL